MRLLPLALCLPILVVACGDDGGSKDTGTDLPDFNYVPLNENNCRLPEDDTEALAVAQRLNDFDSDYTTMYASNLSLCETCTSNGFKDLLASITQPVPLLDQTIAPPLVDYVNKTLSYPYRDILVGWRTDDDGDLDVALAQGTRVQGEDDGTYYIEPESLDETCGDWDVGMFAFQEVTDAETGAFEATTASASVRPFGFLVPSSLPATGGKTPSQIGAEVYELPGLGVSIEDAKIDFAVVPDEGGQGTISGYVQIASLEPLAATGAALMDFEAPEKPGYVSIALEFDLAPATILTAVDQNVIQTAPPTDALEVTTGSLTFDGASTCPGCVKLGTANRCGKTVDQPVRLIQGWTGKFTLKTNSTKEFAAVAAFNGPNGTIKTTIDKTKGETEVRYSRKWRNGANMKVTPKCVAQIASGVAPATFDPKDGWVAVNYAVRTGGLKGCANTVYVCQQFNPSQCGTGATVGPSGECLCPANTVRVFDACVTKPTCAANARISKDELGQATCACPAGTVGNGQTCAADPCDAADACPNGQSCYVDAGFQKVCAASIGFPAGSRKPKADMNRRWERFKKSLPPKAIDRVRLAGTVAPIPTVPAKNGSYPDVTIITKFEMLAANGKLVATKTVPRKLGATTINAIGLVGSGEVAGGAMRGVFYLPQETGELIKARNNAGTLGKEVRVAMTKYHFDPEDGTWNADFELPATVFSLADFAKGYVSTTNATGTLWGYTFLLTPTKTTKIQAGRSPAKGRDLKVMVNPLQVLPD